MKLQHKAWISINNTIPIEVWVVEETDSELIIAYSNLGISRIESWYHQHGRLDFSLLCALASKSREYDSEITAEMCKISKTHITKMELKEPPGLPPVASQWLYGQKIVDYFNDIESCKKTVQSIDFWESCSETEWGWDFENAESFDNENSESEDGY